MATCQFFKALCHFSTFDGTDKLLNRLKVLFRLWIVFLVYIYLGNHNYVYDEMQCTWYFVHITLFLGILQSWCTCITFVILPAGGAISATSILRLKLYFILLWLDHLSLSFFHCEKLHSSEDLRSFHYWNIVISALQIQHDTKIYCYYLNSRRSIPAPCSAHHWCHLFHFCPVSILPLVPIFK